MLKTLRTLPVRRLMEPIKESGEEKIEISPDVRGINISLIHAIF